MILGWTPRGPALSLSGAAAVFSRLDGVKNRKGSAGVEHRKEPCPSGRGPAGWTRFPARSHFTVRRRYLTHRRW